MGERSPEGKEGKSGEAFVLGIEGEAAEWEIVNDDDNEPYSFVEQLRWDVAVATRYMYTSLGGFSRYALDRVCFALNCR